jgi:hypothetical protein
MHHGLPSSFSEGAEMIASTNCDSRQYRFGFQIRDASDFPKDFSLPIPPDGWLSAIFIPGDTEAHWNNPEYPPRIYILTRDALLIYTHPATKTKPFVAPLEQLIEVGTKKALLYGLLEVSAGSDVQSFRYNTLHQEHFSNFLRATRAMWLPRHATGFPVLSFSTPSQGMTFRCWYALKAELDSGEALLGVCCRPAIHRKKKGWFNGPPNALPAVAMAVTDRRLIAVSTGVEETDELYGITVRSAPICKLTAVALGDFGDALMLSLKLQSGLEWKTLFERGQSPSTAQYCDLLERVDLGSRHLAVNVSPSRAPV